MIEILIFVLGILIGAAVESILIERKNKKELEKYANRTQYGFW